VARVCDLAALTVARALTVTTPNQSATVPAALVFGGRGAPYVLATDYELIANQTRTPGQVRDELDAAYKPLKDFAGQVCS
jgi:hypothetical protein